MFVPPLELQNYRLVEAFGASIFLVDNDIVEGILLAAQVVGKIKTGKNKLEGGQENT